MSWYDGKIEGNLESNKKPEVGDVWINTETKAKFVVLDFIKSSEDFVMFNQQTKCTKLLDLRANLPRQFKYLGKSKANIQQLFEVQDD